MPQHVYVTLEVEGDKVVKVQEETEFIVGRPVGSLLPTDLKNKPIAKVLNQLEARGWELKDITEGVASTSDPWWNPRPNPPSTKPSPRKFYLMQFPVGK
jgi:hypothetical protein